jgi:HAD superfamily hydrolase (TIGR01509 family)
VIRKLIKAVLFDVDGVLLDSDDALARLFADCVRSFGFPRPPRGRVLEFIGLTGLKWISHLLPKKFFQKNKKRARDWLWAHYADYNKRYSRVTPGALRAVRELRATGLKTGIVTNGYAWQFRELDKQFGLNVVDFVATIDARMRLKPKPAPDLLLFAVRELGVKPREALYIGDAWVDLEAGKRAGVKTILLAHARNANLKTKRIRSLSELKKLASTA